MENSSETSTSVENQEKCSWVKFSESKLVTLEKKIFEVLKTTYKGWHVPIEHKPGIKSKVWTIALNTHSKNTPLVMLHGFGAGVGFWCMNLDSLAENRPVYAIDILGFGRSSRPDFNSDGLKAEKEIIESIEKWRKEVNIDKFILLGHSMGGYLATSYTMSYPNQVKHLILADPWGFTPRPPDFNPSFRIRTLYVLFYPLFALNPLAAVRGAGPFGPWLIKKMRSDIALKYEGTLPDHEIITDYIYQCNSQKPTGETAFHRMLKSFAFAKHPMLERIDQLDETVPITIMNGSDTWMDRTVGGKLRDLRPKSYVKLEIVPLSGHHVHADNPDSFNEIVNEACNLTEGPSASKFGLRRKSEHLAEDDISSETVIAETQIATA